MISIHPQSRPSRICGVALQPRDRTALVAVHRHRYLTSQHLALLAYGGVSERIVQRRLRALWAAGYVDRGRVVLLEGEGVLRAARPLYSLAVPGAELVASELGLDPDKIP